MEQLALTFEAPAEPKPKPTSPPGLTCAYGNPWIMTDYDGPHHCPLCAADVERACREFDADVAAGKYNAHGYTLNEWKRSGRPADTWRSAEG